MRTALVLLALLLIAVPYLAGDTGTYNIDDYKVELIPRSNGSVDMNYYMKWSVTGGHIPWITVGLPNDNFTLRVHGNAVAKIAPANESGWSGVRIDLDRDYKPGESFEVSFSITQNKLFYADEKNYKLDFTPGWYDRAFTDHLTISLRSFAKVGTVVVKPAQSSIKGDVIIWEKDRLGKGERFEISISFPKKALKKPLPENNMKDESSMSAGMVILIIVVVIIVILILAYLSSEGSGYSGGGIFVGGGSGGGGGRSSGGGGGFGGRSSGCACACVSCACACACAGGGGAGCSRKTQHSCPACKEKEVT